MGTVVVAKLVSIRSGKGSFEAQELDRRDDSDANEKNRIGCFPTTMIVFLRSIDETGMRFEK